MQKWNSRTKTTECGILNAQDLKKAGAFEGASSGGIRFKGDAEDQTEFDFFFSNNHLNLYSPEDDGSLLDQRIPIVWQDCRFGGSRPFFICPEPECGKRRMYLYSKPGHRHFACRSCHNLAYPSQSMGCLERLRTEANRIRIDLGGKPGSLNPLPEKPRGMHWGKYTSAIERLKTVEAQEFGRVLKKLGYEDASLPH